MNCENCKFWFPFPSVHSSPERGLCEITLPPHIAFDKSIDRITWHASGCDLGQPKE